jgi:hypothetical protein
MKVQGQNGCYFLQPEEAKSYTRHVDDNHDDTASNDVGLNVSTMSSLLEFYVYVLF